MDSKPIYKSLIDYWMYGPNPLSIDLFMHRECLKGNSYAALISNEPREFQKILDTNVHLSQRSIIEEFERLIGLTFSELVKYENNLTKDNLQRRDTQGISVGIDFKSPI